MPFGLQPIHLVVIVVVALLVFGPKRLPQIGRWIGRTFSEFRKGARDMTEGFRQETTAQAQATAQTAGAADDQKAPQADASRAGPVSGTASPYPEAAAGNYCTSCGAPNAPDARFCNKCGTRLPT
jgi:sec-independent protein translocase protein TatA